MEARQKQQDAMHARIQEQQEEAEQEEQEGQEGENEEQGGGGEDPPKTPVGEEPLPDSDSGQESPTTEDVTNEMTPLVEAQDRKPLTTMVTKASGIALSPPKTKESPTFPAFYRVGCDSGASVYRHEMDGTALYLVTRVVPPGIVVLGTEMEYRTCVLQKKLMIRMPDGWVNEDEVSRIAAVPFEALQ